MWHSLQVNIDALLIRPLLDDLAFHGLIGLPRAECVFIRALELTQHPTQERPMKIKTKVRGGPRSCGPILAEN
jgi:hypothetical protein